MTTTKRSAYKVCGKCAVRHSTLTRHKCFKTDEAKAAPEAEPVEHDFGDAEGETESLGHDGDAKDEGGDDTESEDKKEADDDGEGDGDKDQREGSGEGDGDGEAEGEGEGEGEEEGDGEDEGPEPQPPEPDAPPVSVVCSVLKFAALTAQAAKGGVISVELTEHGLLVYGHNGDLTAHAVMPWGEFETRSTIDGQFYVKEVIDGVDAKIDEDKLSFLERAQAASEAHKLKKARGATKSETAAKPALTLPLTVGQKVVRRNGDVAEVAKIQTCEVYSSYYAKCGGAGYSIAHLDDGCVLWADTGTADPEGRQNLGAASTVNLVRDAD